MAKNDWFKKSKAATVCFKRDFTEKNFYRKKDK